MRRTKISGASLVLAVLLVACSRGDPADPTRTGRPYPDKPFPISDALIERETTYVENADRPAANPIRNAYFGDLHVHTRWSMDAFSFGTTATPRDAYAYARGRPLRHPAGFEMKLREPLDFYAVTDHALFLGVAAEAADTSTEFSRLPVAAPLHDLNTDPASGGALDVLRRLGLFADFIPAVLQGIQDGSIDPELPRSIGRDAWRDIIESADEFYEPGSFTTFVGQEYTSAAVQGGSLHRNVIFRGSDRLPIEPFSRYNSRNPEGLWDWLDGLRVRGVEALAIPHNSNGSNGQMFALVDWAGDPLDDGYAEQRRRNEPLVEITQVKGTSETHPTLSDNDEWAEFELKPYVGSSQRISEPRGSYVRQALRDGLALEDAGVWNPYKFGFVAASDSHVGATTDEEKTYHSKVGLLDATPELRGSVPLPWWQGILLGWAMPRSVKEIDGSTYSQVALRTYGASGLAAVWAEENTRESIYDAFRRKETFATSGPRIRVRLFAGYDLDDAVLEGHDAIRHAYAAGMPMGSDLAARGSAAPRFFAQATRDPRGAPLQRLQIVKGWVADGETHEKVFDVACSDGGTPEGTTHRCPDNGAKVDLGDCSSSQDVGADALSVVWQDPAFDPDERAFYYVRALENPTCRWSSWDALRRGIPPRPDLHATLQERAWSSPIWYLPADEAPIR